MRANREKTVSQWRTVTLNVFVIKNTAHFKQLFQIGMLLFKSVCVCECERSGVLDDYLSNTSSHLSERQTFLTENAEKPGLDFF